MDISHDKSDSFFLTVSRAKFSFKAQDLKVSPAGRKIGSSQLAYWLNGTHLVIIAGAVQTLALQPEYAFGKRGNRGALIENYGIHCIGVKSAACQN